MVHCNSKAQTMKIEQQIQGNDAENNPATSYLVVKEWAKMKWPKEAEIIISGLRIKYKFYT